MYVYKKFSLLEISKNFFSILSSSAAIWTGQATTHGTLRGFTATFGYLFLFYYLCLALFCGILKIFAFPVWIILKIFKDSFIYKITNFLPRYVFILLSCFWISILAYTLYINCEYEQFIKYITEFDYSVKSVCITSISAIILVSITYLILQFLANNTIIYFFTSLTVVLLFLITNPLVFLLPIFGLGAECIFKDKYSFVKRSMIENFNNRLLKASMRSTNRYIDLVDRNSTVRICGIRYNNNGIEILDAQGNVLSTITSGFLIERHDYYVVVKHNDGSVYKYNAMGDII